jgi:hypothetical protein
VKFIEKTSVRYTMKLTVATSGVRRGNEEEGNKGTVVGMYQDMMINPFASAPPKSPTLNNATDRENATAKENAVVTKTLIGSYTMKL